ncbi:MAG: DUF5107 domain-containing protein [Planctomycetes bacterium]|nr:DUF5107 domain-containing protein [Planctomycetota bacterium]
MSATGSTARWSVMTYPTYTRQPARRLQRPFAGGWMNSYPDTHDDILNGEKKDVDYDVIVLENEHLRLAIVPELGGKLWSAYDKNAGCESIYVPDVIKPCLVARPGAWIPGGMEFNFPVGHHMYTMRRLPCAIVEHGPERAAAVVQRTCPRTGMRMEVRIALAAGEARFDIDYTISNPTPLAHGWYQWTNVGVRSTPGWQFQCKANRYTTGWTLHPYPVDGSGRDTSWYVNRPWPSDSFMVGLKEDYFGYYDHELGIGIAHVAPYKKVRGKKYFTWGIEYREIDSCRVFSDEGHNYLEIQAGPFETQHIMETMQPGEALEYSTTWIPYRATGGIEWADRGLIFNVVEGKTWLYPAVDQVVRVTTGDRVFEGDLKAGRPVELAGGVYPGDMVEIIAGGKLQRAFAYPLEPEVDEEAVASAEKTYRLNVSAGAGTAEAMLASALSQVKHNGFGGAAEQCRKALVLNPGLHEARLVLADALWHAGDFQAGAEELQKLIGTELEDKARAVLARRDHAENAFMQGITSLPEDFCRKLVLAERYACYGNYPAAFRLYGELLSERRDDWRVHYGLASYYWHVAGDRGKALEYASRALELLPGDRDLVLEILPLLKWAGAHDRVVEVIEQAPDAVRELSNCQKYLAESYLETGRLKDCMEISSRVRLHNWEGEYRHLDVYIDCAVALTEDALEAGDIGEAARWAEAAGLLPENLGVGCRHMGPAKPALWKGLVAWHSGRRDEARDIWAEGVRQTDAHIVGFATYVQGDHWIYRFNAELGYALGMCGQLSGDAALQRTAMGHFEEFIRLMGTYSHWWKHSRDYVEGCTHELHREYAKAAECFSAHIEKASSDLHIAGRHLAAVRLNRQWGGLQE